LLKVISETKKPSVNSMHKYTSNNPLTP